MQKKEEQNDATQCLTSEAPYKCFLRDSELALGAGTGLLRESLLKITLHEAALGPVDRRAAHAKALGHGLVRHPGIGRKQDLGALELAGRMPPTADQGLELDTLGFA